MKKLFLSTILFILSGCVANKNIPAVAVPIHDLTTIKSVYAKELSSIKVGDYIKDVQLKFPTMVMSSDNMKNTIYEVSYQQQYSLIEDNDAKENTYTQKLAFYFINKKLVQWLVKKEQLAKSGN